MTEKARTTFRDSFYERTDPELPPEERRRQADAAYRLHMTRLARRAAAARSAAAAAVQELADVADELTASADAV
jgi:hypothetical protein